MRRKIFSIADYEDQDFFSLEQLLNSSSKLEQLLIFRCHDTYFGIEIPHIIEILAFKNTMQTKKVPNIPEFFEGIINVRGEMLLLIDIYKRLGLQETSGSKFRMLLILSGKNGKITLLIDEILEIIPFKKELIVKISESIPFPDFSFINLVMEDKNKTVHIISPDELLKEK